MLLDVQPWGVASQGPLRRGQTLLAPFVYSDLAGSKGRPACVVSSAAYNDGPDVIVAMITSGRRVVDRPGFGDVVLSDWNQAGLRLPSVLRAGRLMVLEQRLLGDSLGDLSGGDREAVDLALMAALGLTYSS
jgi:mRNA interferase MazF